MPDQLPSKGTTAVRVRLAFKVVSILDVASYYIRPLTGAYVWAVNWSEDMAVRHHA